MASLVLILLLMRGFAWSAAFYGHHSSDVTEEGCFSCVTPNQSDILAIAGYMSMCPESDLWGTELTTPFVSRQAFFTAKFWQARTVDVRDSSGNIHYIILPFVLNSGGVSVMVGRAAVAILRAFGATAKSNGSLTFCNLNVPLPLKAQSCVTQWDTPTIGAVDHDQGFDIREHLPARTTGSEFVLIRLITLQETICLVMCMLCRLRT